MNFVNRSNYLIDYYSSLPEVQRLKELESYIDNNKDLQQKINELDLLKVEVKEALQNEDYEQYRKSKALYDIKYEQILDIPFVEEYIELINIIYNRLELTANIIEKEIRKELK